MRPAPIFVLVAGLLISAACTDDAPRQPAADTAMPAPATATLSPRQGRPPVHIDRSALYVASVDGSGTRLVYEDPRFDSLQVALSRDGDRIAIAASDFHTTALLIVDSASGDAIQVLTHEGHLSIDDDAWSPDGRYIALRRSVEKVLDPPSPPGTSLAWELALYDVRKAEVVPLARDVLPIAWSSDSSAMFTTAEQENSSYSHSLFRVDVSTGETDSIVSRANITNLTTSPGSDQMAYIWRDIETGAAVVSTVALGDGDGRPIDHVVIPEGSESSLVASAVEWAPSGDALTYTVIDYAEVDRRGVYTLDLATGAAVQLTHAGDAFDYGGRWSPLGNKLLVTRGRCYACDGGQIDTLLIDDGGSIEQVFEDARTPTWSPDGSRFAFSGTALFIVDSGGVPREIARMGEEFVYAGIQWSGDSVYFIPVNMDWTIVHAIDPATGGSEEIMSATRGTTVSATARYAAIPDSDGNVVISEGGQAIQRFAVTMQGAEDEPVRISDVAWSPGEDRLAVASASGASHDLVVFGVDGTIDPIDFDGPVTNLRWSPDGRLIAFSSEQSVYVTLPHSRATPYVLASPTLASTPLDWSPDGSEVAFLRDGAVHAVSVDEPKLARQMFVAELTLGAFAIRWAPAGDRVAVATGQLVVGEAGTDAGLLVEGYIETIGWASEGATIAFGHTRTLPGEQESERGIFLLDVDTGRITRVTASVGRRHDVIGWLSDGRILVASIREL